MKQLIVGLAVSAVLLGTSVQPALAQDAGLTPAPVQSNDSQQQAPVAAAQTKTPAPMLSKPVPKRPPADGVLVAGGILGGLAVIGLAAGGGGGGNDQPSSP